MFLKNQGVKTNTKTKTEEEKVLLSNTVPTNKGRHYDKVRNVIFYNQCRIEFIINEY